MPLVISNIPVINGCLMGSKLLIILKSTIIPKIDNNVFIALLIDVTKLNFLIGIGLFIISIL